MSRKFSATTCLDAAHVRSTESKANNVDEIGEEPKENSEQNEIPMKAKPGVSGEPDTDKRRNGICSTCHKGLDPPR